MPCSPPWACRSSSLPPAFRGLSSGRPGLGPGSQDACRASRARAPMERHEFLAEGRGVGPGRCHFRDGLGTSSLPRRRPFDAGDLGSTGTSGHAGFPCYGEQTQCSIASTLRSRSPDQTVPKVLGRRAARVGLPGRLRANFLFRDRAAAPCLKRCPFAGPAGRKLCRGLA
jgi:hypothetical protein